MWHIWTSHATHTCKWATSHIPRSRVADAPNCQERQQHNLFIYVTWLVHMCDVTHSYVWHDSCICVTRLIHMCDVTHSYVWRDSRDSIICFRRLVYMCGTHFTLGGSYMCDVTHAYVWGDSYVVSQTHNIAKSSMNESCRTYEWVTSHIGMSHVTHMKESCRRRTKLPRALWMSHVTHMNESRHT